MSAPCWRGRWRNTTRCVVPSSAPSISILPFATCAHIIRHQVLTGSLALCVLQRRFRRKVIWMADLSEYTFFEGVDLRKEVRTLMQIFEDSLEECRAEDCRQCKYRHGKEQYALLACIRERYAENLIAAAVAPVRHGRWEWFEDWDPGTPDHPRECQDSGWRCGECKTALEDVVGGCWDDSHEEPKLKFCPNCGCCMDGGESNE